LRAPSRAVHLTALDLDTVLAQANLFLHPCLDDVAADVDPATLDLAFADADDLLDDRDCLLIPARPACGSPSGATSSVLLRNAAARTRKALWTTIAGRTTSSPKPNVTQVKEAVDLAQQVIVRDGILEAELKTGCLIAALPNHHAGRPLLSRHNERNHGPAQPSRLGAAKSGH
jgi:hypothetical protein